MLRSILRAAVAATLLFASPVFAQDHAAPAPITLGSMQISGAFTRATLPNAPVGGGFLTITNTGGEPDRLVSVASPVSGNVQMHQMAMDGDVMKMSALPDGIDIPAGQSVTLSPGGLHIMFMGIQQPFVQGKTVPVTLSFEKAGTIDIELSVLGAAADGPAAAH